MYDKIQLLILCLFISDKLYYINERKLRVDFVFSFGGEMNNIHESERINRVAKINLLTTNPFLFLVNKIGLLV